MLCAPKRTWGQSEGHVCTLHLGDPGVLMEESPLLGMRNSGRRTGAYAERSPYKAGKVGACTGCGTLRSSRSYVIDRMYTRPQHACKTGDSNFLTCG